jgi:hypothetical protein
MRAWYPTPCHGILGIRLLLEMHDLVFQRREKQRFLLRAHTLVVHAYGQQLGVLPVEDLGHSSESDDLSRLSAGVGLEDQHRTEHRVALYQQRHSPL